MRDNRPRIFLEVIGRQPVVFITNKGFKKAPGASRDGAPGADVSRSKLYWTFRTTAADIECDQRRQSPGGDERKRERQRAILREDYQNQSDQGNRFRSPHK